MSSKEDNLDSSNPPGAELSKQRKLVTKTCEKCGEEYKGLKVSKYCSLKCKNAKHYDVVRVGKRKGQ